MVIKACAFCNSADASAIPIKTASFLPKAARQLAFFLAGDTQLQEYRKFHIPNEQLKPLPMDHSGIEQPHSVDATHLASCLFSRPMTHKPVVDEDAIARH